MPIFRIRNLLVYYCHVPKAAGTAIEAYLAAQFGPLAFLDEDFSGLPVRKRWTRSSPQHIDVASLKRLFPQHFFDETFAVVRHPIGRLVSAYKFQKFIERKIPSDIAFKAWVQRLRKVKLDRKRLFDNHFLPASYMVPNEARVFRLEDGLGSVIDYLQTLAGPDFSLPGIVQPANVTRSRILSMGAEDERVDIDEETRDRIAYLYREDFERFGYSAFEEEAIEISV